jgi:hypothetical protein
MEISWSLKFLKQDFWSRIVWHTANTFIVLDSERLILERLEIKFLTHGTPFYNLDVLLNSESVGKYELKLDIINRLVWNDGNAICNL